MIREIDINTTVTNSQNEIIHFSLQRFLDDIVNGDCCFICGAKPESKDFNDEHVIPKWILKKYKLFDKQVILPNDRKVFYRQFVVPCCEECNTNLGRRYEKPLGKLLNKSYDEIVKEINSKPELVDDLFIWLSLIFFKTHYKDRALLVDPDPRKNSGRISDNYYWEEMHHIHCLARSHYSRANINSKAYGTTYILPAIVSDGMDKFDYLDHERCKTIMIKLNEFVIIVVLNDSFMCRSLFRKIHNKINAKLSPFQLREIYAHLNYLNLNLSQRPKYKYTKNSSSGVYNIDAIVPSKFSLIDKSKRISSLGEFLKGYVETLYEKMAPDKRDKILREIESGKGSYLFDESGNFIKNKS